MSAFLCRGSSTNGDLLAVCGPARCRNVSNQHTQSSHIRCLSEPIQMSDALPLWVERSEASTCPDSAAGCNPLCPPATGGRSVKTDCKMGANLPHSSINVVNMYRQRNYPRKHVTSNIFLVLCSFPRCNVGFGLISLVFVLQHSPPLAVHHSNGTVQRLCACLGVHSICRMPAFSKQRP